MPAFLKDITPFLGTGENNEEGKSLAKFLEDYDPYAYKNPAVTADVLVIKHPKNFTQIEKGLQLLMIKRRNHPSIGCWALPGGFVNIDEDIELAAKRELEEETGVSGLSIEMVGTYGEANRDPRGRIVTVSYVALVEDDLIIKAGDDAEDACFVELTLDKVEVMEEVKDGKTREITKYLLKAENAEKGLKLEGVVEYSENKTGILKEKKYRVLSSEGIAFDHARFIVETTRYLARVEANKLSGVFSKK